jgi:hypothetical protein
LQAPLQHPWLHTQQQQQRKRLKNATAFLLPAKTTVQLAQAQHVQAHPKLITKATLGHSFQLAHVLTSNFQLKTAAQHVLALLKLLSATSQLN